MGERSLRIDKFQADRACRPRPTCGRLALGRNEGFIDRAPAPRRKQDMQSKHHPIADVFSRAPQHGLPPSMQGVGSDDDRSWHDIALRKIRFLMDFHRITPEEIEAAPEAPPSELPEIVAAVKYRHPQSGATWDGEGSQPAWLREALLHEGFTVDELRAQAAAAAN